jgi:hypothetical protein
MEFCFRLAIKIRSVIEPVLGIRQVSPTPSVCIGGKEGMHSWEEFFEAKIISGPTIVSCVVPEEGIF